jgi:broad specificity phosphatase PhoE
MPTLYFVRHATPDWSRTDIPYFTPPGPPLTAQGEGEANEVGAFLRDMGARHFFASPLERCQRTAHIAAGIAEVGMTTHVGLTEWKPGDKDTDVKARLWPVWEYHITAPGPLVWVTHGGPIGLMLKELGLANVTLDHYKKLFDRGNPLPPAGVWRAERDNGASDWALSLAFVPEAYRKQLVA